MDHRLLDIFARGGKNTLWTTDCCTFWPKRWQKYPKLNCGDLVLLSQITKMLNCLDNTGIFAIFAKEVAKRYFWQVEKTVVKTMEKNAAGKNCQPWSVQN